MAGIDISFNTEIINIGKKYLFHSYWTEPLPDDLSSNITGSPITLRLYKKSKTDSSHVINDTYKSGAVNNYKYIDPSNTGLDISLNWNTTNPHTMDIYTDINGDIFYNTIPISDASFIGWTESEIDGAWLMILQRNFTYETAVDPSLILQGCYAVKHLSDPYLILDQCNNDLTYSTIGNTYADACNNWIIERFYDNEIINLPSFIFNSSPSLNQLTTDYIHNFELLNFTMKPPGGTSAIDNCINFTHLNSCPPYPYPKIFYPPFYDSCFNVVTSYIGCSTNYPIDINSYTLDLNNPLVVQSSSDTLFIKDITLTKTFFPSSSVSLYTEADNSLNEKMYFTMQSYGYVPWISGPLFIGDFYIDSNSNPNIFPIYFAGPYYDENYNPVTTYPGYYQLNTSQSVNIDLTQPLRITQTGGNTIGIVGKISGSSGFWYTFYPNTSVELYIKKHVRFAMQNSVIAAVSGNVNANNIYFCPNLDFDNNQSTSPSEFYVEPPFYDANGNLLFTYPGKTLDGELDINLDLSKPIKFIRNSNTYFVYCYNTFDASYGTFNPGVNIDLIRSNRFVRITNPDANKSYTTGLIKNQIKNRLKLEGPFVDELPAYGDYYVTNISGEDQTINDFSTNSILIFPEAIDLNSEIVQVGSEYVFHSYWEEKEYLIPYLSSYLTDASYALRLYYKDSKTIGTVEQTYLEGNTTDYYKYVDVSNIGLTILPNWKTTSPYTMDIYTDKLGNVFYNAPPTNVPFNGWQKDEIENAWFMVLQRNFYDNSNASAYTLNETQACYVINLDTLYLTRLFDTDGSIKGYTPTGRLQYPGTTHNWSIKPLFKDQSYNFNTYDITIDLPNIASSEIVAPTSKITPRFSGEKTYHTLSFKRNTQIATQYFDTLENGFDLDGVNYNISTNGSDLPTKISYLWRGFHPPFYDTSGNLVTDASGISDTYQLVDLDLTKSIRFYQTNNDPQTNQKYISIRATPKGDSGDTIRATFYYDASVTLLMDNLNGAPQIETISFTMDNSVRGKVVGSYTLNGGLYPASQVLSGPIKYFYAPFMDNSGRYITELSGVNINDGTPLDFDLKQPIKFYNSNGNIIAQGISSSNSYDVTFIPGTNVELQFYEVKRAWFTKAPYNQGFTTISSFGIRKDSSSNNVFLGFTPNFNMTLIPPFFDKYGNYLETYPGIDSNNNSITIDMTKHLVFRYYTNTSRLYCDGFNLATNTVCSFIPNSYTELILGGLYTGSGILYDNVLNQSNLNIGVKFTEKLGNNYKTLFSISGEDQTFNVIQQAQTLIYPQPIIFNTEIQQIGSEYLFHSYWEDPYKNFLTNNITQSPYTLRLYNKSFTSVGDVEKTYLDGSNNIYKLDNFTMNTTPNNIVEIEFTTQGTTGGLNRGYVNGYVFIDGIRYDAKTTSKNEVLIYLEPPFYDITGKKITEYDGEYRDQTPTSVLIDMTKKIKIDDSLSGDTFTIFATSVGQTGDTFDACFKINSDIKFLSISTDMSGIIYNSYKLDFTMQVGGYPKIVNDVLINDKGYGYLDFDEFLVYPPFYDSSNTLILRAQGYDGNTNFPIIDLEKPIKFYTNGNSIEVLATPVDSTGNTFSVSFLPNTYSFWVSKLSRNTGLNISNNWKTTTPNTMDIYTDKTGNVFYNSPPINDASFVGWTQNEIKNAWFMVLQQNFTNTNYTSILLQNQGCYTVNILDPLLTRSDNIDGEIYQIDTTRIYLDSTNKWSIYEYDTNLTYNFPNFTNSYVTGTELETSYSTRIGTSSITNRVINKLNIGSRFAQEINNTNYYIHGFNNVEQTNYDVCSNSLIIYEAKQEDDSSYNLTNVMFSYNIYDTSKVYFDIWFIEPDESILRPEAYDINIYKKTQGTGTALSQWYPNGQYPPYIWQDEINRGITISKNDIPSELKKYKIDTSGTVLKNGQGTPADLSGSFETGGYIVTLRRNFYQDNKNNPNIKDSYYTLSSQFVCVPPTQETSKYSLPINGSSLLKLEDNSQTVERLELTTPIYGAYSQDGSTIDICFNVYIDFDDPSFNPSWQSTSIYSVSGDYAYVNLRDLYTAYYGFGNGFFYFEVSYNWIAPSQLSLPIGDVGGFYPTFYSAVMNPDLPNLSNLKYTVDDVDRNVLPNIAITNTIELTLPVDSSFARLNEVQELQAAFIGTDTTRMLAIKWREPNVDNLSTSYTGYPYALRLYKKNKDGYTPNDQWYARDASGMAGIYPYKWVPDYFDPNPNNYTYDGVEISANFFPQITTGNYLYFFADASGNVYYNNYPTDTEKIKPFTEPGGYIIIVQRHYIDLKGDSVFTTFGQYLNFIPFSSTNPWELNDFNYPIIASKPNPYSSFLPGVYGGTENLQYYWTLNIPNINYDDIIPFQNDNVINIEKIQEEYRNRGKEAFITSYVTYDFGLTTRPFFERYPLLRINGNPNYTTPSIPYVTNLCSTSSSLDPPEWPRFRPECLDSTPEEREAYQMRRKAETLLHVQNRNDMRTNKKNWFSFVAKGYNQKNQTFATQTDKYTNPNTKNYPVVGGAGLTLPADCPKKPLTFPSYCSDVPGATVPLTFDPNVPLINYKTIRRYTNSETEYTEKNKN